MTSTILSAFGAAAANPPSFIKVDLLNPSRTWLRDVPVQLRFDVTVFEHNFPPVPLELRLRCDNWQSTITLPARERYFDVVYTAEFTPNLTAGAYELVAELRRQEQCWGRWSFPITVAGPIAAGRMAYWYWPSTVAYRALEVDFAWAQYELDRMAELGITMTQIDVLWALANPEKAAKVLDYALSKGIEIGLRLHGGQSLDVDGMAEADVLNRTPRYSRADPWSEAVAERNRCRGRRAGEFFRDFQGARNGFINTEVEDTLELSKNPEILKRHAAELGFDPAKKHFTVLRNPARRGDYVAPGVLRDSDEGYRYGVWFYQHGDGVVKINRDFADAVKSVLPEMFFITDPQRNFSVDGRFAGVDVVSTWTYTNPDPKMMLFADALIRQAAPLRQQVYQTITLWNYGGVLRPMRSPNRFATDNVMASGADRIQECIWLNLSRGVDGIGYYASSLMDFILPGMEAEAVPPESFQVIGAMNARIIKPYGALFRRLRNAPRKVAILSSMASHIYSTVKNFPNYYPALDCCQMLMLLNMAHLQPDVLYEDDIRRGALDDYELLVLARCETIPESVYGKICDFAVQPGKKVVADAYLRAAVPNVLKFHFDVEYRLSVTAEAIAKGLRVDDAADTVGKTDWRIRKSQGVTALEDRDRMESYAARLHRKLGDVYSSATADTPRILVNELTDGTAKYLALVNDHRGYDARVGKYQAILEQGLPQTGRITWRGLSSRAVVYDALTGRIVGRAATDGVAVFDVALAPADGMLLLAQPRKIAPLRLTPSAETVTRGTVAEVRITLKNAVGTLPVRITLVAPSGKIGDYSQTCPVVNGKRIWRWPVALNAEPGRWQIRAEWSNEYNSVVSLRIK